MLGRQVQQALRVYTTHGTFWAWVIFWLVGHVVFSLGTTHESWELVMVAPLNAVLGLEIGRTLAAQFSRPGARLLPAFAKAHLVAAGGLVFLAASTHALLVGFAGGPVPGAIALTVGTLTMGVLVAVYKGRVKHGSRLLQGLSSLGIAVFVLFWLLLDIAMLERLGTDPLLQALIGCFGIVAMVAIASRLVNLSEDSPGYLSLADGSDWDVDLTAPLDHQIRGQAREVAFASKSAILHDSVFFVAFFGLPRPGRWRRIVLRQLAHGASSLSLLSAQAVLLLLFLCLGWIAGRSDFVIGSHFVYYPSMAPFAVAMIVAWSAWPVRVDHLAWESLLPIDREAFASDMAIANRLEMTTAAVGHCLVILALAALMTPRPPVALVSVWLALIVAQYLVGYNLLFWINSFGSSCVAMLLMGIACFVLPGVTTVALVHTTPATPWHAGTVAPLVAALIASIGLHRLAVRRWCRMDLEWNR
ncbi:MAG: hypothetical protein RBS80_16235 [Thermoguttaceae bacterium]|jgi:hypothetical protein|nr:hypothetical protein [Thermoguttaceae bacterium]